MRTFLEKSTTVLVKALWNRTFLSSCKGLLRGTWIIIRYSLLNRRVKIEFPFLVFAPVVIRGRGRVHIGRGCSVWLNVFEGLTIVTYSPDASVTIGKGCLLGGLTVRCKSSISIGENSMTGAPCLVQDSLLAMEHRNDPAPSSMSPMDPKPITIGKNVWMCNQSYILGGSRIGDDCVLANGSLTYKSTIEDYRLIMGNPSDKTMSISTVMKLTGGK
jgi:acetyltransferase-like isoleucine patch superfamily enzyme